MQTKSNAPSVGESREALASVKEAQAALHARVRSPLWLTIISACLLGTILLSRWIDEPSTTEATVLWLAGLAFFGLWASYMIRLKRKGLGMRFIPKSATGRRFLLVQMVFYFGVMLLTDWLFERGFGWAPWVGTGVMCTGFAVILHHFPTGEPIGQVKRQ